MILWVPLINTVTRELRLEVVDLASEVMVIQALIREAACWAHLKVWHSLVEKRYQHWCGGHHPRAPQAPLPSEWLQQDAEVQRAWAARQLLTATASTAATCCGESCQNPGHCIYGTVGRLAERGLSTCFSHRVGTAGRCCWCQADVAGVGKQVCKEWRE